MADERYAPPGAPAETGRPAADALADYVGFWPRLGAALIDLIALSVALAALEPLMWATQFGHWPRVGLASITFDWILPAVAVIAFWVTRGATPGKMVISAEIVDATTFARLRPEQCLARYLAYFLSLFGCLLGFAWIGFDDRKQGWHDKIANTVVIRRRR